MSARQASLVTLEELGAQLGGGTVETAAARLAATGLADPVEDWRGRLCVPSEVAARAVLDYQDEVVKSEAQRAAYNAYVAEREERRRAAGQVAAEKAQQAAHEAELRTNDVDFAGFVGKVPADNAHTRAAGREVQREALIGFDAKHPLTPFEKFKGGGKA